MIHSLNDLNIRNYLFHSRFFFFFTSIIHCLRKNTKVAADGLLPIGLLVWVHCTQLPHRTQYYCRWLIKTWNVYQPFKKKKKKKPKYVLINFVVVRLLYHYVKLAPICTNLVLRLIVNHSCLNSFNKKRAHALGLAWVNVNHSIQHSNCH